MKLKALKNQDDHRFEDIPMFGGLRVRRGNFGVSQIVIDRVGRWLGNSDSRIYYIEAYMNVIERQVKLEINANIKKSLMLFCL